MSKAEEFGISDKEAMSIRLRYLKQELSNIAEHKVLLTKLISGANDKEMAFISDCIKHSLKDEAKIRKTIFAVKNHTYGKGEITSEMIEQARNYPIRNLIKSSKGLALCVNHGEKNPSMNTKNNFAYCHACGWHGDTIEMYMKINRCNFKDAVKSLQ